MKTDKVDVRTITSIIMSAVNLKSNSDTSVHNEDLNSLTRYRFDIVKERAKLKTSITRLVTILFTELEKWFHLYTCLLSMPYYLILLCLWGSRPNFLCTIFHTQSARQAPRWSHSLQKN